MMEATAQAQSSVGVGYDDRTIDVKLIGEAADTLADMSSRYGIPIDKLLETSISLLKVGLGAREVGRRFVLTTKMWWPIKEFILPRAS
jgi:hypothetical protein